MSVQPSASSVPGWGYGLPMPPRQGLVLGQLPPDFALWDVSRQRTVRLANARGKQPLVLILAPLGRELAYDPQRYAHLVEVNQAYQRFRNAGGEVVVVVNGDRRRGQILVDDLGLTLSVLCDSEGATFRAYHTGRGLGAPLPAQFVLDAQGRLRYGHWFSLLHPYATVDSLLVTLETL